jgi:2,3-bisphosphoglycerate-dependent phosphoglycerate mutase
MANQNTTFYIVRHGETLMNRQRLLQGHTDSPLTREGELQVRRIAETLRNVHFDQIFSSDLLRARRTAEIISLERNLEIQTTATLRERSYGIFDGKPYEDYNAALRSMIEGYADLAAAEIARFNVDPSVETIEASVSRLITFLRELAVGFSGQSILIVSHGSIMRYLLIHLGFATHDTLPPGTIDNTAYIQLESDGVDFYVRKTEGIHVSDA